MLLTNTEDSFEIKIEKIQAAYDKRFASFTTLKELLDNFPKFEEDLLNELKPLRDEIDAIQKKAYALPYIPENQYQRQQYYDEISRLRILVGSISYSTYNFIKESSSVENVDLLKSYESKLEVLESQVNSSINEYNNIADLIGYRTRLALGTAQYNMDQELEIIEEKNEYDEINFTIYNAYRNEAIKSFNSKADAEEALAKLNLGNDFGLNSNDINTEYVSASVNDNYGWFPSGINC